MNRKSFLKKIGGLLLLSIPAYSLLSCSSSSDDDENNTPPPPNSQGDCLANGATASSISGNHGHTLTISKDDVDAGVEKTYSIKGTSGHDHSVTLTASHFTSLKSNQSITVSSTAGGGHTHSVTVSCA